MRIQIDAFGEKQVSRNILRVGDNAGNAAPAFKAIIGLLRNEEEQQFDSQGSHASGGWAPLAESTLAQKTDPRILHDTLALRESLTKEGADHAVDVVLPHMMVFGSDLGYAGLHQRGTGNMPQRRPLELTAVIRGTIVKVLQRYILRK